MRKIVICRTKGTGSSSASNSAAPQTPPALQAPSDTSDFIIHGKVLRAYVGRDRNVTIPEGIMKIFNQAFEGNKAIHTMK